MYINKIIYLALTIFLLYLFFTVGFPFLMAYLIALMLEPFIQILMKAIKVKRVYSSFIVCSGFTVILFGLGYLVVVKGVTEGISLSKTLIAYIRENYQELTEITGDAQSFLAYLSKSMHLGINDLMQTGVDSLQSILANVSELLFGIVTAIPNLALEFLIFVIALYLCSFSLPTLKKKILSVFDEGAHPKIELVLARLYHAVLGFIRAQIIISFFIFIVTLAGLIFLGVRFAVVLAIIITVVDILPVLGTGTIIIPLSIFYLLAGNIFMGIGLLVLYGSLVALRRIIEPKILGDAIGIGALATLASMYIGFKLTGFIGLFFGPATIILVKALMSADILQLKIKF